jgi:hypothetical protein
LVLFVCLVVSRARCVSIAPFFKIIQYQKKMDIIKQEKSKELAKILITILSSSYEDFDVSITYTNDNIIVMFTKHSEDKNKQIKEIEYRLKDIMSKDTKRSFNILLHYLTCAKTRFDKIDPLLL